MMKVLNLALVGSTARYRAISADDVARAMVRMSLNNEAEAEKVVVAEGLDFYC